jgi:hypothetical protein
MCHEVFHGSAFATGMETLGIKKTQTNHQIASNIIFPYTISTNSSATTALNATPIPPIRAAR